MNSALYVGTVMHGRRSPRDHVFRYPVSYWLFDLDELFELERRLRLFSVNRRNVVSLRDADHFDGTLPLKQAVIDLAGDPSIERVLMLTQPRVLGYVFNPVSFYWCYRGDDSLGPAADPSGMPSEPDGGARPGEPDGAPPSSSDVGLAGD